MSERSNFLSTVYSLTVVLGSGFWDGCLDTIKRDYEANFEYEIRHSSAQFLCGIKITALATKFDIIETCALNGLQKSGLSAGLSLGI